jgi:hypothetical protein
MFLDSAEFKFHYPNRIIINFIPVQYFQLVVSELVLSKFIGKKIVEHILLQRKRLATQS